MKDSPKVSVIIPVYNTEHYLEECLSSVIHQSLKDIEIICVNDGSTDNSATILEEHSEADLRIHIITQKNQGQSVARNMGIKIASGKYVCFLDSDDMLADNALEELYTKSLEDNLDILCYDIECMYETDYLRINDNKDSYYQRNISFGGVKTGRSLFSEMIEKNSFLDSASNMLICRDWMINNQLQFYPGILYEDSLFSFQCYMKADRIFHTNNKYVVYRVRENSTMTSKYGFHNLYSRLICYIEIIKMTHTMTFDVRTQAAIRKFAFFVRENLKYIDYVLDSKERMKIQALSSLEKLYLDGLGIEFSEVPYINEEIYLDGFKNIFVKNKNIILYGAGQIGRQVIKYLANNHLDKSVLCFAVTNPEDSHVEMCGLPVICIDELKDKAKDGYIIITARKNYQEDMCIKVRELGFIKITVIDYRLERAIRKE